MHNAIRIIVLMFLFNLSSESALCQKLFFRYSGSEIKSEYELPISVKCFFKNGQTKALLLDSISADSLHFRRYYNAPNYDCSIQDIQAIRINRTLNPLRDVIVVGGIGTTVLTLSLLPYIFSMDPLLSILLGVIALPSVSITTTLFFIITKNKFDLEIYEVGEH